MMGKYWEVKSFGFQRIFGGLLWIGDNLSGNYFKNPGLLK